MSIHSRTRAGRGGGDATGLQLYPEAKFKKNSYFFRHDGIQGFTLYSLQPRSSRNGALLSEEAQRGGPMGKAPSLRTLEDMLRKPQDTGMSLHRGPWNQEEGLVYRGL